MLDNKIIKALENQILPIKKILVPRRNQAERHHRKIRAIDLFVGKQQRVIVAKIKYQRRCGIVSHSCDSDSRPVNVVIYKGKSEFFIELHTARDIACMKVDKYFHHLKPFSTPST
ncbi:hypothetical protein D9M72_149610 [compost metagenome]